MRKNCSSWSFQVCGTVSMLIAFMSCSSIGCCFEDCFAMTWVAPAQWPGLHGVPGPDEPPTLGPDAPARRGGEQVVAVRCCELAGHDRMQLHVVPPCGGGPGGPFIDKVGRVAVRGLLRCCRAGRLRLSPNDRRAT